MSKILIVEDEQVVAHDIALSLRALGYQVTKVTSSAEECLSAAEEELPDLVLMDIHIDGDVDGVQAAKSLQARYDLPVIFRQPTRTKSPSRGRPRPRRSAT